ncbi:MAG: DMT family transporter [Planctomycetota bacterium]|jgi:O-acetylserine/cysteine efflux transporter
MIWGAWFFSERVSKRRILGFLVSVVGLGIIASAKETASGAAYPLLVGITALAPLSWSLYSVVTKPVSRDHPPILWAYLTLVFGTVPLLALAPLRGGLALYRIDAPGWTALLYLSLLCTVFGYAAWTWLVKHLPASTVGFTIFLNPPLTTISKALLAAVLPAAFAFRVVGLEWVGGAIVLIGMGLAVTGRKDGAPTAAEIYETP